MYRILTAIVFCVAFLTSPSVANTEPKESVVAFEGYDVNGQHEIGAGAIISARSGVFLVLTAAHVARLNHLSGVLYDGTSITVSTIRMGSSESDVAVVTAQVTDPDSVTPEQLMKYRSLVIAHAKPEIGDTLTVVGHPLGQFWTVSHGVVNRFIGPNADFVFSCDTCAHGDSGGPVLNGNGEIVGIMWGTYVYHDVRYQLSAQREHIAPLLATTKTSTP